MDKAMAVTRVVADVATAAGSIAGEIRLALRSGFGDLTIGEVNQIQKVVNETGRPLEVIGSAASGTRRGVGTDLPLGKGAGTKSDIDYITHPQYLGEYMKTQNKLPSIDPQTGVSPGVTNPYQGPGIRFEPGEFKPIIIPKIGG